MPVLVRIVLELTRKFREMESLIPNKMIGAVQRVCYPQSATMMAMTMSMRVDGGN